MKQFIFDNWLLLSPILYEIIARVWPTKWNISLLDNIWKFVDFWIPNKRIPSGKERQLYLDSSGKDKNMISVLTNKHILKIILIFCLFSFSTNAQIWQNFKGVRLVNNSDTTKQFPVQGSIFFDDVNNKFWGHNSAGWKEFILGVSGNFWSLFNGGTLTGANIITQNSNAITFGNTIGSTVFNSNGKTSFFGSGGTGIEIDPTPVSFSTIKNTKVGNISIEQTTVGNINLINANGNIIQAFSTGFSRFSADGGTTGIDIIPSQKRIENIGAGTFSIQNNAGILNLISSSQMLLNPATLLNISASGGTFITTTPPTDNTAGIIAIKVDGQIVKRSDITGAIYTPTITNQANVSASNLIANTTTFTRIQNIVRVETAVNITATATATLTQIGISLPVVSDLGAANISGMGVTFTTGENQGEITGDIINDVARFNFTSVAISATFWRISFQYTVN